MTYTARNLPWRVHPFDPKGRIIVARHDSGSYISIAQTRWTENYKYSVAFTEPGVFSLAGAEPHQITRLMLTPAEMDKWLERIQPKPLTFGPPVYRKAAA